MDNPNLAKLAQLVNPQAATFIVYLQVQLIPDLQESGRDATVEDFETLIKIVESLVIIETLRKSS